MNNTVRKSLVAAGIITATGAIAAGVYLFYKRQFALALQYCYKISNVKFIKVSKDNITLEIFIKIQNKSDFTVELKGYNFFIFLNEKKIANVVSDKSEMLAAKAISTLSFMVTCDPAQIFDKDYLVNLISYAIADKKKIVLQVNGTMDVKMNFINLKKVNFNYKTTAYEILNTPAGEKVQCDIV